MWLIVIGIIWAYVGGLILCAVNKKTSGYLDLSKSTTGFFSYSVLAHGLQLIIVAAWPVVAIVVLTKYYWDTRN